MKLRSCLAVLLSALSTTIAQAQINPAMQGIAGNEVLLGSIIDLSGPVAAYGKDVRNGLQMGISDFNARGGAHGRKLRLVVEDNAYDPKRSVLAAQKLVNQDKVFGVVGTFGTPNALAAMQVQLPRNVFSLFPMALSRDMYEPLHKLKFAMLPASLDQIRGVVPGVWFTPFFAFDLALRGDMFVLALGTPPVRAAMLAEINGQLPHTG